MPMHTSDEGKYQCNKCCSVDIDKADFITVLCQLMLSMPYALCPYKPGEQQVN